MHFLTKISTSPTEPVSVKDMNAWLRLEPGTDDAKVAGLITAARSWAEDYQRRSLTQEQFKLTLDHFPYFRLQSGGLLFDRGPEWDEFWNLPGGVLHADARRFAIELPRSPLISIDGFTYLDTTGTLQTLAPAAYQAVTGDDSAPQIYPADGTYWPVTAFDPAAVTITFTAGILLNNLEAVAIKMIVADSYDDPTGSAGIPPKAKDFLIMNRIFEF